MDCNAPLRWRRLAWVTYGNAYLQRRAPFGLWQGHGLFREACTVFRRLDSRELIAEDGFEWLWLQRANGARRLSLLASHQIAEHGAIHSWDSQVVCCHFADRIDIWALGHETSTASRQAMADPTSDCQFGRHGPDTDAYFLIESRESIDSAPVATPVNWKKVRSQFHAELAAFPNIGFGSALKRRLDVENPWFKASRGGGYPEWANLPTLPADGTRHIPHSLLNAVCGLRGWMDNATHPKNEGNIYFMSSDEELVSIRAFDAWIDRKTEELQCLCASDPGWEVPNGREAALEEEARQQRMSPRSEPVESTAAQPLPPLALMMIATTILVILTLVWLFPKTVIACMLALILWQWRRR